MHVIHVPQHQTKMRSFKHRSHDSALDVCNPDPLLSIDFSMCEQSWLKRRWHDAAMAHTTCSKTSLQAKYAFLLPTSISYNAGLF